MMKREYRSLVIPNDALSLYEKQGGLPYFLDRFEFYAEKLGKTIIFNLDFEKIGHDSSNLRIVHVQKPKSKIFEVVYRFFASFKLCRKHNVDFIRVLEGGTFVKSFTAGLVGTLTGTPVVVSIHGVYNFFGSYMGFRWYHNLIFKVLKWLSGKLADLTFVVDASQAKELHGWKNVYIVPNYFDETFFRKLPITKKYDAVYVGSLIKKKGIDVLIDTFKLVKRHKPNFNLAIIGSGDVAIPKMEGLHYLGAIPNNKMPPHYNLAKLFVTASYDESFCIPVIEAQACGLPIVATDLAPLARNTIVGVTSKLSPIKDANALANNILLLLNNKKKMQEMSIKAQQFVRGKFSKNAVLTKELALIKLLME